MSGSPLNKLEAIGRATASGLGELGFAAVLLGQSIWWTLTGHVRRRPVRISAVFQHARDMGISALPIIILMNGAVGIMLAIQGIYTLRLFGAEEKVVFGVALSVVREFSPVITGIIVAGRTGSALAARLGTMRINQEIDALSVMGIDPVRFLVAPALLAILVMLPLLTFVGMMIAMSGAALYVSAELGMSLSAYATETLSVLTLNDLTHGLGKTLIFAMIIVLVGVVNGASVTGGAEGVGRMTTRSVVQGICGILVTDMIFAFVLAR